MSLRPFAHINLRGVPHAAPAMIGCFLPRAALLVWLLWASTPVRAETLLRWKLQPEQTLRMALQQTVEATSSFSNKPVKMVVEMTMELDWQVEAVDKQGTAQLTESIRRIAIKAAVPPAGEIEFDSASTKRPVGDAKELAAVVAPLIGAQFSVKMSDRGRILDVVLPDQTTKALEKAAAGSSVAQFLSQERLEQLLRQSAVVLPEKPVSAGESWQTENEIDSPFGKIRQANAYTFAGEETSDHQTLAKITLTSQVELAAEKPIANFELKEQSLTGTLFFNPTAGRMVSADLVQTLRTATKVRDTTITGTVNSRLTTKIAPPQ